MYSCQDRTQDFNHIVGQLKSSCKTGQNGYAVQQNKIKTKRQQLISQRSQFTVAAKKMTSVLAGSCARLERLSNLVKTTSLFDDKSAEIHELTTLVKEDMANLTNEMSNLQLLCSKQNGVQSSSHSRSIVQSIQSRLNRLSVSFNDTLQNRVASLKTQAQRRELFSKPVKSELNGSIERSILPVKRNDCQPKMPSLLLEEEEQFRCPDLALSVHGRTPDQMFTQQVSLIDRTDDYLESRNENIRDVERTIVDMGKIFEQLSMLIHEQGEQVDDIYSHVEETSLNVESGHKELLKFYQSVTSNRWLMLKVFGVLFVFVIIFVVLLA